MADLTTVASQGIAEIAEGTPDRSGEATVAALRQNVWARDTPTTPPILSGAAFAAYTLGFLTQDRARVFAHGRWTRLYTETGNVLILCPPPMTRPAIAAGEHQVTSNTPRA